MQRTTSRGTSLLAASAALLIVAACGSGATAAPVASTAPAVSSAPAASTAPASAAASAAPASAAASAPAASAAASAATGAGTGQVLKVALVCPSAKNDLAFSESMVDALNSMQQQYHLQIAISDNQFVVADAGNVIRQYASEGYNLVIAHGSQYGSTIQQLAPQFPKVSFAWGTAGTTYNLPNVFAYQAASNEGGYVQGAMAAMLSKSKVLGVIGPIAVGDAKLYVDGFVAGAKSVDKSITVNPVYTGSFSDASLFAAAAKTFVSGGADVLTGTAQAVVGAIGVARSDNLPWFGTQWTQASLAPKNEVSAQVYDWTPILKQMFTAIRGGTLGGATYTIGLGNGGEVIQYNSGYNLPASVKAKGDSLIKAITEGTLNVPQ